MDLHIHSSLSPCAEMEMLPTRMIEEAKMKGLDAIGICDHNSVENVLSVRKAGEKRGIQVIGGIEVTSSEEVHILGFFDDNDNLFEFQDIVYKNLKGINDEEKFGIQSIVNENDEFISTNKRLLIGATELTTEKIVDAIHCLDGLAIASHIDRPNFSIISQLGFIPEGLKLDALELSPNHEPQITNYENYGLPFVSFSDAHRLDEIGRVFTFFMLKEASIKEIKKALKKGNLKCSADL